MCFAGRASRTGDWRTTSPESWPGSVRDEPSAVPRDAEGKPIRYVFEMLAAWQRADDRTRFYLQAYIGNHTLFITGLFPGRIERQRERRGAPGIGYYEGMGRSSFKAASDHRLAERYDLDRVLATLAEAFGEVRGALNDLGQYGWFGLANPCAIRVGRRVEDSPHEAVPRQVAWAPGRLRQTIRRG